jgi:hypothetical protein
MGKNRSELRKNEYYKHETLRQFILLGILFVLAQLWPKSAEAAEIFNTIVVLLCLATVGALIVDYVFFWGD